MIVWLRRQVRSTQTYRTEREGYIEGMIQIRLHFLVKGRGVLGWLNGAIAIGFGKNHQRPELSLVRKETLPVEEGMHKINC